MFSNTRVKLSELTASLDEINEKIAKQTVSSKQKAGAIPSYIHEANLAKYRSDKAIIEAQIARHPDNKRMINTRSRNLSQK